MMRLHQALVTPLVVGHGRFDDDLAQVHAAPGPSNENAPFLPHPGRQIQY